MVYDVVVAGVGSIGSSVCYHLAKNGVNVLGIDANSVPNDKSSHNGESRLTRKAYFEHPQYVPILKDAHRNWRELEQISDENIFMETGIIYAGPSASGLITGLLKSADQHQITIEECEAPDFLNFPDAYSCYREPEAGYLLSEKAIKIYKDLTINQGANIRENCSLISFNVNKQGVQIKTSQGVLKAKKLLLTAGPGNTKWVDVPIKVTLQALYWLREKEKFEVTSCWAVHRPYGGIYYGFPALGNDFLSGTKTAIHFPGRSIPDNYEANSMEIDKLMREELSEISKVLKHEDILHRQSCKYTMTKDEHFLLDWVPGSNNNVYLAGGFSGHGFKFASALGPEIGNIIQGKKGKYDLSPFSFSRF